MDGGGSLGIGAGAAGSSLLQAPSVTAMASAAARAAPLNFKCFRIVLSSWCLVLSHGSHKITGGTTAKRFPAGGVFALPDRGGNARATGGHPPLHQCFVNQRTQSTAPRTEFRPLARPRARARARQLSR